MGLSRGVPPRPQAPFQMEVVQEKSSREAGASLGGSGHRRDCMERLFGFLLELLEFQKDILMDSPQG